jgi:Tol biopolymer transport system component
VLAYRTRAFSTRQLLWRRRDGSTAGLVGKPGEYSDPVLSPDGRSVAIQVGVASPEVWVRDLVTGVMTNIHIRPAPGGVSWSPDSTRLAVTSGNRGIVGISLASGKAVPLTDEPVVNGQWLPDGRTIFCTAANRRRLDLLTLDGSPKLRTIMEIPNRMEDPRVSPDGRYVAYLSIDSSGLEAYVSSFPTFAAKRKISSGGARSVVWAKSGKELFYQSEDGTMNAVDLRAGDAIETGTPRPLFKFSTAPGINRFDVAADGRFLIAENVQKDETDRPEIILVLNWTAAMRP